jgi:IclR family transcriptional regulator, acetate operon repressor
MRMPERYQEDHVKSNLSGGVQAVHRSLALLENIASVRDAALGELAREVKLPASTTHRLLATLNAAGYVAHDPVSRRYRLGPRLVALGQIADQLEGGLADAARPALARLQAELDETANLVMLDGSWIVYIDQIESARAVRMSSRIGNREPAHASAAGKAILAQQPSDVLDRVLARSTFERLTPNTITTVSELRAELAAVRARGYAIDSGETNDEVMCIASPLVTTGSATRAALSICGPIGRMRRHGPAVVGQLVAAETRRVAHDIRKSALAAACFPQVMAPRLRKGVALAQAPNLGSP